MRRFFVYSTPRSGSAWLANFLTYGGSFCQHEPMANGPFRFTDHPVSGAVDTGAAYFGYLPPEGTRIFHLYRDLAEVDESLKRIGLPTYDMSAYCRGFEYEKLFDVEYLHDLWNEITGLPFDRERAEMLIEMNVQRDLDKFMDKLRTRLCR